MSVCQSLVIGVPGLAVDKKFADLVKEIQPGGFILFSRNIQSPLQLRKLVDDLYDLVEETPFIMIDQEGGRVARLREMGAEPPSARELREKNDLELIRQHGLLTGQMLSLFNINFNLCPVVDVGVGEDRENSLKNRCFGMSPEEVVEKARVFNSAMQSSGVLSCAKHFPSYSFAAVDPHHDLPRIDRSREEMDAFDWKPFREMVHDVDSFMMAHALYPQLQEKEIPSSLSSYFVNGILREEWGFEKLIVTDDLDMGAILNFYSFEDSIKEAVRAGNDLLLICHRYEKALEAKKALQGVEHSLVDQYLERISKARSSLVVNSHFSLDQYKELDKATFELRSQVVGPEKAAQKSAEDAARSPVEEY